VITHLRRTAKAYVAAAVAAITFAIPLSDDGLKPSEALGIALSGLVAWQAVYWTPRGSKAPQNVAQR
jgi:membrane protease YdiL (CAAX protease family)